MGLNVGDFYYDDIHVPASKHSYLVLKVLDKWTY